MLKFVILSSSLLFFAEGKEPRALDLFEKAWAPFQGESFRVKAQIPNGPESEWVQSGNKVDLTVRYRAERFGFATDGKVGLTTNDAAKEYLVLPYAEADLSVAPILARGYPVDLRGGIVKYMRENAESGPLKTIDGGFEGTLTANKGAVTLVFKTDAQSRLKSYKLTLLAPDGSQVREFEIVSVDAPFTPPSSSFNVDAPIGFSPAFTPVSFAALSTDQPLPDWKIGDSTLSASLNGDKTLLVWSDDPAPKLLDQYKSSLGILSISRKELSPETAEELDAIGSPLFVLIDKDRNILGQWMGRGAEAERDLADGLKEALAKD